MFLSIKSAFREMFEGSCDTEDWSNDAENSDLHHMNKLHFTVYYNRILIFISNNISRYHFMLFLMK